MGRERDDLFVIFMTSFCVLKKRLEKSGFEYFVIEGFPMNEVDWMGNVIEVCGRKEEGKKKEKKEGKAATGLFLVLFITSPFQPPLFLSFFLLLFFSPFFFSFFLFHHFSSFSL